MITKISITNYRNIPYAEILPKEGISILVEPNGFGKTNFLESIYYSIFRSAFRPTTSYAELVNHGEDFGRVTIELGLDLLELLITVKPKQQRLVKLNGKRPQLKVPPSKFPVLLFAPHSVDLVSGEPNLRRTDLDNVLSIYSDSYAEWVRRYKKVLRNRNTLIKAIQEGNSEIRELKYWTEEIIKYASLIHKERAIFFESIQSFVTKMSQSIYHDIKDIRAMYIPNLEGPPDDIESIYRQKYSDNEQKELIVGKTLYGVHKDDFEFIFNNGQSLRYQGSRGQQRIGSFIFKLAQFNLLKDKYDKQPILLIDDIFSELDQSHRKNIGELLLSLDNQIIMTGADINEFPTMLVDQSDRLTISK